MCIDKTESSRIIYPRKLTPNLKHQELRKQKLTCKTYYGKGCMSSKNSTKGLVVKSFDGISG